MWRWCVALFELKSTFSKPIARITNGIILVQHQYPYVLSIDREKKWRTTHRVLPLCIHTDDWLSGTLCYRMRSCSTGFQHVLSASFKPFQAIVQDNVKCQKKKNDKLHTKQKPTVKPNHNRLTTTHNSQVNVLTHTSSCCYRLCSLQFVQTNGLW